MATSATFAGSRPATEGIADEVVQEAPSQASPAPCKERGRQAMIACRESQRLLPTKDVMPVSNYSNSMSILLKGGSMSLYASPLLSPTIDLTEPERQLVDSSTARQLSYNFTLILS